MIYFQAHPTYQTHLDPKRWGQWATQKEHTSQEIAERVTNFYLSSLHPKNKPIPTKLFVHYYYEGDPTHKSGAPMVIQTLILTLDPPKTLIPCDA